MRRPAEDTPDGERTLRAADVKEWWSSVFRLVNEPAKAAAIVRAHEPNEAGLFQVCVDARTDDPRNLPWPCPTHAMAANAIILRPTRSRRPGRQPSVAVTTGG